MYQSGTIDISSPDPSGVDIPNPVLILSDVASSHITQSSTMKFRSFVKLFLRLYIILSHKKVPPESLPNKTLPSFLNWHPPSSKSLHLHFISGLPSSGYAQCTQSHHHPISRFYLGI